MNLCKFIIPINMNHLLFFRKSCWLALLAFVMIGMPGCSGDDTENPRTDMPEIEPTTRDVRICLSEVKLGTRTSISGSESDTPELVWNDGDPVSYAVSLDGGVTFSTACTATMAADGYVTVKNVPNAAFDIGIRYPAVEAGSSWSIPAVEAVQQQAEPDRFNGNNLPLTAMGTIPADNEPVTLSTQISGCIIRLELTAPDTEMIRMITLSADTDLAPGSKNLSLEISSPSAGKHVYYCVIEPGLHDLGLSIQTDDGSYTLDETLGATEYEAGCVYRYAYVFEKPAPADTPIDGSGTANCYVLDSPGTYSFDAATPGNGTTPEKTSAGKLITEDPANYDAAYLWTTGGNATGIVSAIAYDPESQRISFTVPDPLVPGSVVVALYEKSSRQIVWSWHLWVNTTVGENQIGNYAWMNQNLGATSASDADELGSYGFYYQFGRKDPEVGAIEIGSINGVVEEAAFADKTALTTINTEIFPDAAWEYHAEGVSLEESVRKPMRHSAAGANSVFTAEVDLKTIWGNGSKTMYDPCPPGYKVPTGAQLTEIVTAIKSFPETTNATTNARKYEITADDMMWLPMPGYRLPQSAAITQLGRVTHIWGTGDAANPQAGYTLRCTAPGGAWSRASLTTLAYGATVRCIREE